MKHISQTLDEGVLTLTLNRSEKRNAFNEELILSLQSSLEEAIAQKAVQVILLNANGSHFCAGADIEWLKRMGIAHEKENIDDAMQLGKLLYTVYTCPKPTIASVHGATYGGGIGLVAACDIAIAGYSATFCFSEVKLGMTPAVISPYVVQAMGERLTKWLFITATPFHAEAARQYNLVHLCKDDNELHAFSLNYAKQITRLAPQACRESKALAKHVALSPITPDLVKETALLLAKKRMSDEGLRGLNAFLRKETPHWDLSDDV